MELLRSIESIRTPFLDTLIGLITRLGEETIGIVLLCLVFWCISKKIAYVIGVAFFLSGLTVQGMKICFRIERPWVIDPTFEPVPGAELYATGYSFPSGHTQSAAAFYGALGSQVKPMAFKVILFAIPVLVAFSRMYLGVHSLQDVLVSLVITFLLIWVTCKLITSEVESKKKELAISLFIILYAVAVIMVAAVMYSNGTIEDRYIADCLKAAGAGIGFAVGMFVERVYIKFSVKSKNIGMHIIKVVIGIAGVLTFQEGLKYIIGTGFIVDMFRYFLMISWVTMLYPLLIKRFFAVERIDK